MERLQDALSRARDSRGKGAEKRQAGQRGRLVARPQAPEAVLDRWASLPVFDPNPKILRSNRILSFFGKQEASAFDMMRTKILQQALTNKWRRIALTSPTARCGKTTIAANLAFSLARQTELRTLVIEIDMRRPGLARALGISEPHYFAKVLAGQEPPERHMLCYAGNVAFATNQAPASNPSELLQSGRAREILAELEEAFAPDLVLFDTSPLLASDDTIGFLKFVDAAILVAAAELTTIDEIDVAETEIANSTQVLGVVLNKSRYSQGGYGYEYSYY